MEFLKKFIKWSFISILILAGIFLIAYAIIAAGEVWGFVIFLGILAGLVIYFAKTILVSIGVIKLHKRKRYSKIRKTNIASSRFKDAYEYIENKYAKDLEQNRKKLIKSIIICIILFVIGFCLVMIFYNEFELRDKEETRSMIGLICFVPLIWYYAIYRKYNIEYIARFKNHVIKNFVQYINPGLTYENYPGKEILDYYIAGKFQDKQYNKFVADDYVYGYNQDGTKIEICNFSLEEIKKNGELDKIVYEGIFSVSKLNENIPGEINIKKNKYILKNNNTQVQMDSTEFEKYFDVHADSEILAMQILTHDIMEVMVDFYSKYKIEFEIKIKNNRIFIRFNTGVMFEPNILKKSNDINTLWIYYNVLKFVTDFSVQINKLLKDLQV